MLCVRCNAIAIYATIDFDTSKHSSIIIGYASLVKSYDYVIVGGVCVLALLSYTRIPSSGTLASHINFIRLQSQNPKASILLLEPPLEYRSLIFTFFAGLDLGVHHNVPYFRAYPFYRSASTADVGRASPHVRRIITTFQLLIDELAQDLAAHEDLSNPAVKLPCYRIVQRVQPSCMKSMLPNRTAFPIQYNLLRKAPHLKVLLGVDSIAWLTNTRDQRLAIQVQIQNQGNLNANDSTLEPHIAEEQFEKYHDDQDFEPCSLEAPTMIRQRFLAFRRISVNEDSCPMWTFDTADEFNSEAKADEALAVQILVGFDSASPTSSSSIEDDPITSTPCDQEFFDTATCFKVAPLTHVSEGWIGLEIEQTVFCNNDDPSLLSDNDDSDSDQEEQHQQQQHPLAHWGFEMIQRVFDSLNSDGIVDIHSDTASMGGPSPHQSPGLSPSDKDSFQYSCDMTSNSHRHSEMSQPRAKIHKPSTSFLIMNKHPCHHDGHGGGLPSYLARIWNIIFEYMDDSKAADVSKLLADPKSARTAYPFSAKFASLLGRSQQQTPEQQEYQQENNVVAMEEEEEEEYSPSLSMDDKGEEEEDDDDDEATAAQEPAILKIANSGQAPTMNYREDQQEGNESDNNNSTDDEHHRRYSTSDSSEDEDNALNNVQQAIGYYTSDPYTVAEDPGEPTDQYHERLLPVMDDDDNALYHSDLPLDGDDDHVYTPPVDEEESSVQDMPVEDESQVLSEDNNDHHEESDKEQELHEQETAQVSSKHDGIETDTEYFSDTAPIMKPEEKPVDEMIPEQPNSEVQQPEEKETIHNVPPPVDEQVEQKPLDVQTGSKKKKKTKKGKKRNAV
ncbi:hypothetical protein K492DRAFT_232887 [Lichtheimia hyalospora FSU 10163]|nr:hypothetical protein K492DRAFT_232887 [Lichtheimia hyalospora FSU 10163]